MNNVQLIGRPTKDPVYHAPTYEGDSEWCRFTLAVDRRGADAKADFISIIAWGKTANFASKYVKKGVRYGITGQIRTGTYEKDGETRFTQDVVAQTIEFCEKKAEDGQTFTQQAAAEPMTGAGDPGFMNIPDGIDEELPFS